jgi:hypothetical protein
MTASRPRAVLGSLAAFALLLASDAGAQTQKWDQAKVTALAGQLSSALSGLRNALMNSAEWQASYAIDDTLWGVAEDLRMMEFEATQMNADLTNSAGMKQTLPAYVHLQQLHREVSQYQGQMAVGAFLAPPLAKAKGLLAQLAAYYPPQPKLTQ